MPPPSLLDDEVLREIIAVGRVDVLVGIPTYQNEETIADLVRAVHRGLDRDFLRERTVVVNADGGSTDRTRDLVRAFGRGESPTVHVSQSLRTQHLISTPYHGLPGRGPAVRQFFAIADLLQARAVVVVDPEVTSFEPGWVKALVHPVLAQDFGFVAPAYRRHPLDGPLVSQLARPLVRAAFGVRLLEPLGGEFACSGAFAARALESTPWDDPAVRDAPDPWLVTEAIASGQRVGQAVLGPRVLAAVAARPGLPEVMRQVLGAVLFSVERHAAFCRARQEPEDVPLFGAPAGDPPPPPAFDTDDMARAFREGATALDPVLEQVLSPESLEAVRTAAAAGGVPPLDEDRWAAIVAEFVAAHQRAVMRAEHLFQALVPIYLGRVARFVTRHAPAGEGAVSELESLSRAFERARSWWIPSGGSPPGR